MRRLRQEPALLEQYDHTIKEQLEKGIIETVDPLEPTASKVHYLPHHAVVRTDKTTTKLRVVYDASARSTGPSLNDCLHKGPKFNQLILDLLLRFQSYRIALTADIEKAFLMISVDDHDRDVLRFLWVDDISKADPEIQECSGLPELFSVCPRAHFCSTQQSSTIWRDFWGQMKQWSDVY